MVHPGGFTTATQLHTVMARIRLGQEPWAGEYAALRQTVAALPQIPVAPAAKPIYCGSYNRDPVTGRTVVECDASVRDMMSAYSLALYGYLSGNNAYSAQAVRYLSVWSANFRGFDPQGSNAPLVAGWMAPWVVNTAELLRYNRRFSGWSAAATDQTNALLGQLLPWVTDDAHSDGANWQMSRIQAQLAIAVFRDDRALFDSAVARWRRNAPSYIYITKDNGHPVIPNTKLDAAAIVNKWGTSTFVDGMTMETCRDLGHQGLGIDSIVNSMAIATSQRVDITDGTDMRARLAAFLVAQSRWRTERRVPEGICNGRPVLMSGSSSATIASAQPVAYDMAFTLLHTPQNPLTTVREAILAAPPSRAAGWVRGWETLTYRSNPGEQPPTIGGAPQPGAPQPSPQPTADTCTAVYQSHQEPWPGGFVGHIVVTAKVQLRAWTVTWPMPGRTSDTIWGARSLAVSDGSFRVVNETWNGALAPGSTAELGFSAAGPRMNPLPRVTCIGIT